MIPSVDLELVQHNRDANKLDSNDGGPKMYVDTKYLVVPSSYVDLRGQS